jgi:hypothetical protein
MSSKGPGGSQKQDIKSTFTSTKFQTNIVKRPPVTTDSNAYTNGK